MPPVAESDAFCPKQIVAGVDVAEMVRFELTVTKTEAVDEQPAAEVPVTKYVVLVMGLTEMGDPLDPLLQAYVLPPVALKSVELPTHIVELAAEAPITGSALTEILTDEVAVHPAALVPVTV